MGQPKIPAGCVEIFLQPGEIYFGGGNIRLTTLLGSCVSVSCWHPKQKVGGLTHFLLPQSTTIDSASDTGRYADRALQQLLAEISNRGLARQQFEFKLFGGASSLPLKNSAERIGAQNIMAARQLLAQHQIELKAEHTGGHGYRNLKFDLWNGQIWLKYVELNP